MKSLISVVSFVVVCAWVPASWAQTGTAGKMQASPTLAWNRIALEAVERTKPNQLQAMRLLAYVSLAQYAALAEAQNEQESEAAIATVSMRVIAELIPSQAAFVDERLRQGQPRMEQKESRVAQRVLAQAYADGFAQSWNGQAPQAAYAWRSLATPAAPPAYPAVGAMRTLLAESGSILRPAPPPALGSTRFLSDLAEVRKHTQSPSAETTRLAKFYDMTTKTLVAGFWNERATEIIRENSGAELERSQDCGRGGCSSRRHAGPLDPDVG